MGETTLDYLVTAGPTTGPVDALFRDNFAGQFLLGFDYMGGIAAAPFRDGDVRGLFSNQYPSGRELMDAKMNVVLIFAPGPKGTSGRSVAGTRLSSIPTSELIPTHQLTMSRRAFRAFVEDIRQNGIKESLKYVEVKGTKYVVDGHHRLRAASQLGVKEVPAQEVQLPYAGYKTLDDLFGWYD